jgi:outer membrane protein OmpA-like peptidoglycan-associated protein
MFNKKLAAVLSLVLIPAGVLIPGTVFAQDLLPADNGLATYHTSPRYRESESHPLRIAAYVAHPVGWLAREVVFRPLSYFASSTELTRSIMGYREPFDYRQPECFSADDSSPDCRSIMPFNYDAAGSTTGAPLGTDTASLHSDSNRQVYFPDVNFDFNGRKLNDLGRGRAHQLAALLKSEPGLKVVLQGNADYKGSDAYNERLGLDRAEAVRQELVSLGVPADRLSTVTFGESQPILAEQEDWARAVNRRVEVHVDVPAAK